MYFYLLGGTNMNKYMKYVFFIEAGLLTTGNGEEKQQFIDDWTHIVRQYIATDKTPESSSMPIGILKFMEAHQEKSFIDAIKELTPRYKDAYRYPHIKEIISDGEEAIPLIEKKRLEAFKAYAERIELKKCWEREMQEI